MPSRSGITLLGLGPGDPLLLTRQAHFVLQSTPEIYLRTRHHPIVDSFPKTLKIYSFDDLYDEADTFQDVYCQIVEQILRLGRRPEGVVYAVPGHPYVAEATGGEIIRLAQLENLPTQVIAGISFLDPVFMALNLDPFPQTTLVDALELLSVHYPLFSPDVSVIIAQIYSREIAAEVKITLMALYPDHHPIQWVHAAGTPECLVESLPLHQLEQSKHIGLLSSLYVPPLGERMSLEALQEIVARLRAPDGCPWDRVQTHQSLRKYLLEETYEVLETLDTEDVRAMSEELGDLLLQIVLHTQIASEMGDFTMADVIQQINTKLIYRHPHVFGGEPVETAEEAIQNWEHLKEKERILKQDQVPKTIFDGVPITLPALLQSSIYQKRVAHNGFDSQGDIQEVLQTCQMIESALASLEPAKRAWLFGEFLFRFVTIANQFSVDPEMALRDANTRFRTYLQTLEM